MEELSDKFWDRVAITVSAAIGVFLIGVVVYGYWVKPTVAAQPHVAVRAQATRPPVQMNVPVVSSTETAMLAADPRAAEMLNAMAQLKPQPTSARTPYIAPSMAMGDAVKPYLAQVEIGDLPELSEFLGYKAGDTTASFVLRYGEPTRFGDTDELESLSGPYPGTKFMSYMSARLLVICDKHWRIQHFLPGLEHSKFTVGAKWVTQLENARMLQARNPPQFASMFTSGESSDISKGDTEKRVESILGPSNLTGSCNNLELWDRMFPGCRFAFYPLKSWVVVYGPGGALIDASPWKLEYFALMQKRKF